MNPCAVVCKYGGGVNEEPAPSELSHSVLETTQRDVTGFLMRLTLAPECWEEDQIGCGCSKQNRRFIRSLN